MSIRIPAALLVLLLSGAAVAPMSAIAGVPGKTSGHVLAQKSARKGSFGVYLPVRLTTGHRYRVEVVSSGHQKIRGNGFENYTYVSNKHLIQGTKPLSINGSTPYSLKITQPISAHLGGWILVVNVQLLSRHPLTVRVRDLGKHK